MSDNDGARSYKTQVIGDSMSITINFKWLIQLIALVGIAVYGFWKLEDRIGQLENNVNSAMEQLMIIEEERKVQAEANLQELKQELSWYQKELNLNPFFAKVNNWFILQPTKLKNLNTLLFIKSFNKSLNLVLICDAKSLIKSILPFNLPVNSYNSVDSVK